MNENLGNAFPGFSVLVKGPSEWLRNEDEVESLISWGKGEMSNIPVPGMSFQLLISVENRRKTEGCKRVYGDSAKTFLII